MENIIVILIVAVSVLFLAKRYFRKARAQESCDCGCSGCDVKATCDDPMKSSS